MKTITLDYETYIEELKAENQKGIEKTSKILPEAIKLLKQVLRREYDSNWESKVSQLLVEYYRE